jgi:hypothetical protein
MSLRHIDLRFVLPQPVRRAAVLDLPEWEGGLHEAGVEVARGGAVDLIVAPVARAAEAVAFGAAAVILEGRGGARALRRNGYRALRCLPLPTLESPDLLVPLSRGMPVDYALRTWRPGASRAKQARNAALVRLSRFGVLPDVRPVQTVGLRVAAPPAPIARAHELGVPVGVGWFLTLGQGDALTRAVFHVFPPGAARPSWALKLARVRDYDTPFRRDERGLSLANEAGGSAAAHAPRFVGRFTIDGHHASLETAAVGERLSTLLPRRTAAARTAFADIATWTESVGRETAGEGGEELARLAREVVPRWNVARDVLQAVRTVPGVLQHNDLGTWNVVAEAPGRFTVLDWESARDNGLPLWDLLYFAVDGLGQLDRAATFEERTRYAVQLLRGDVASSPELFELVQRYVRALRLAPEAVGPLATLCWLHHGLSHRARAEAGGSSDPAAVPPAERIAPIWLEDPLLGPTWDRWRP